MLGRDSHEDLDAYGLWPWIGGLALAALVIWLLFAYSTPIS